MIGGIEMNSEINAFINKYVKEIRNNNAAFFAGAGFSKESGYVDWKTLLESIASELGLEVEKEHDLVALAQYCYNKHQNRGIINDVIFEEFSKQKEPTQNHRILARLPIGVIWTTNYDDLIEKAFDNVQKIVDVKSRNEHLSNTLANRECILYKMHGDKNNPSVLYFQWRKSRGSSEKFHGAVVDHDASEKNRVFQEVAWIGKDLEKLSSQILSTCNRAKVAIIMDWENWWALSDAQAISRKFDYTEELLKYYRVFWEKGIEVDIISMDRELSDYQLVVAPTLYLHKKEYIHKVEAYVEAGGIYVTTYWSGVVNETDLCFIGERPHERLLGLSVDEIDVGNEYFPNTFSYKDGVYKAGVLREVVTLQTAKPLGTYLQDYNVNTPAITENAYGKGKAYYVVVQPDLEFLKEFLGDVIEEANVEANLTETLPYGVTVSKRSGKEQKDDVYFLQNFNRHPVKMVLNECYTNLITDEILTGSIKLQTYQCIVMQKK